MVCSVGMFLSKHLVKSKMTSALISPAKMSFVAFKGDRFKDKGRGEEEVYFSEQERALLKKLVQKLETEAQAMKDKIEESTTDEEILTKAPEGIKESDLTKTKEQRDALKQIFEKHGIKDDHSLYDELSSWKNTK